MASSLRLHSPAFAQSPKHLIYIGQHNIVISPGAEFTLQITGNKKDISALETQAEGERLTISDKLGHTFKGDVRIEITLGELEAITLTDRARLLNDLDLEAPLALVLSGQSSADLQLQAPNAHLQVVLSDRSLLKAAGVVDKFSLMMKSEALVRAKHLKARQVEVSHAGSQEAEVFATEMLDAYLTGAGMLYYSGNPHLKQVIEGSGEIHKR